ncbi:MAG: hypothetical protein HN742_31635 [Lentisphaerae bacterium]|jgi:hypothetical protein|nr:hypothetical protein [Lentisphaerota bacterium]MBT4818121.1 hypothetical protein [Lentisphaerota bacterium]MBT5606465.1 hypothetical protein [Lentisphaerota bacterium]MBT7055673.1 hypothetical protein [Lentisphaerota bacterium]MBT7846464.1 hypothetical protein [Lentisphaerota bacterium]
MRKVAQQLIVLTVAAMWASTGIADELVIGDGSEIRIPIRHDGTGRYAEEFDQDPKRHDQHAFAVEGKVSWRAQRWKDLAFEGSRVLYKVVCSRQVTTLTLSFAFWGSEGTEAVVWASPDGTDWEEVFSYVPAEMGTSVRLRRTLDLSNYLSPETHAVFVRMGTREAWGLLYGFSLAALPQTGPKTPAYRPGPAPRAGAVRYGFGQTSPDESALKFIRKAGINVFHWPNPLQNQGEIPERALFNARIADAREAIAAVHAQGAAALLELSPCSGGGNADKRTQLFDFCDRRWKDYGDYFGSAPEDALSMTQRDADGTPRRYRHGDQQGYHLCVNSPSVRQYTMGLIRMGLEAGADGNVIEGLRVETGNCYCEWCRFRFIEWLGNTYGAVDLKTKLGITDVRSVVPPTKPDAPLRVAWRGFAAWSLADFIDAMKSYGESLNPNYILTARFGLPNGEPFSSLRSRALDLEQWSASQDVVFAESRYGTGPRTEAGVRVSNSSEYRYLAAASRGKAFTFLEPAPATDSPRGRSALARLAIAESVASGGSRPCNGLAPEAQRATAAYHAFLKRRESVLTRLRPWSPVRIWASLQQAYHRVATFPMPCSRYLADRHIPHLMITDRDILEDDLGQVEALILPTVRIVSSRQLQALRRLTERGLGLILIGPCATHDEWGNVRDESWISRALAVEGTWPGEPRRIDVGRGRLAYLPGVPLPEAANAGLPEEGKAGLRDLAPSIAHVSRRSLPAATDPTANVEISIAYDGGNTLLVHVVNYGVGLDGAVEAETALPIKVRLPKGKSVKRAVFVSPDEDTPSHWLPFTVLTPGPARYVEAVIPGLDVYGQIEYELSDEKPIWDRLPVLQVAQEGSAAPGGEVILRLALSRRLAAGWRVEGPEGWTFRFERMEAGETRCIAGVPADATTGRHPLDLAVGNRGMGTLTDRTWVRIEAPLALELSAPPHLDTASRRTRVQAMIRSQLREPMKAEMTVTLPAGWPAPSPIRNLTILPGRATPVGIWVQNPRDVRPGTYAMGIQLTPAGQSPLHANVDLHVLDEFAAIVCPELREELTVDGALHEPCWQAAATTSAFVRSDGGSAACQQTQAWAAYDSATLYIAINCAEHDPAAIVARQDSDGGDMSCDDSIQILLDRGHGHQTFRQFVVNAVGAKQPAEGWEAVTRRTESGWTTEIAIPLPVPPEPGDMWGLNVVRNRPQRSNSPAEHTTWAPIEGTVQQPRHFRHLVFAR